MFIKIKEIKTKYENIPIKGIIHVGAHEAEEYDDYNEIGINKIIWVEGNPKLYGNLKNKFLGNENIITINEVIYDSEKKVKFNISNNGQSSSILDLKEHKNKFSDVVYVDQIEMVTKRMDTLLIENYIKIDDFNFMNVDVQGADLNVILSMGEFLKNMDFIYTEINTIHMYDGCHLINEMDESLSEHGFIRTMTHEYHGGGWGDALYVKKNLL